VSSTALQAYEDRYPVLPVADAREIVGHHVPSVGTEIVDLEQIAGRILAAPIIAEEDVPSFPAATVDGYAIDASTRGTDFEVALELIAGEDGTRRSVGPRGAARIMTGAPLPRGTNAVVMFEDADESAGRVRIRRTPREGENVRAPGSDLARGQEVLPAGSIVGPPEIGLLASLGIARCRVGRRARVAILSTGDEIVSHRENPGPGAIRDSNGPALVAAVEESGGDAVILPRVGDDYARLRETIERALGTHDVLITSGGVSVGTRDLIKPILESLGTVHFGRIALRPGKPLTFATSGARLVFGLPGNPVSALVTFEVFVRPVLRRMQGDRRPERPRVQVVTASRLRPTPDRTEYQRASIRWEDGTLVARSTGSQSSSRLLSMAGANGLLEILPGGDPVDAGTRVPALITGALA